MGWGSQPIPGKPAVKVAHGADTLPMFNNELPVIRDALEGREVAPPPPPLQGARPKPSHCPPDGKCRLEWHL